GAPPRRTRLGPCATRGGQGGDGADAPSGGGPTAQYRHAPPRSGAARPPPLACRQDPQELFTTERAQMSRTSREYVGIGLVGGLVVVGSLLGGGCTAGSPPVALEQARAAYAQAQQTPQVVAQAPVALQEAEQALRRAERVWTEDHDLEEVQHLADLTLQRVEIAKTLTEKKLAEASIQQANQERERVVLEART